MKRTLISIVCFVLAATGSLAVPASDHGEEKMDVFMMSEKDESCIQVEAGKPFAIGFHSSPGTGYSWEFAAEPDKTLLEFRGERIEEPENGMPGGRVTVFWTFQPLAAGETEIALKYARPWEKEAPAAKKHVFKVQIR